jgi:hypothetical protein
LAGGYTSEVCDPTMVEAGLALASAGPRAMVVAMRLNCMVRLQLPRGAKVPSDRVHICQPMMGLDSYIPFPKSRQGLTARLRTWRTRLPIEGTFGEFVTIEWHWPMKHKSRRTCVPGSSASLLLPSPPGRSSEPSGSKTRDHLCGEGTKTWHMGGQTAAVGPNTLPEDPMGGIDRQVSSATRCAAVSPSS